MSEEAAAASEGETHTRLGADAAPAEANAWTDVEDADVVAAEGVKTRTRTRACGDAFDDAEDAAAETPPKGRSLSLNSLLADASQ